MFLLPNSDPASSVTGKSSLTTSLAPCLLISDTHYITCQYSYSALSAHCSLYSLIEFAIFTSEFSNSQLNTMLWNCPKYQQKIKTSLDFFTHALRYTVQHYNTVPKYNLICLPWALCFSRFCNFCRETVYKIFWISSKGSLKKTRSEIPIVLPMVSC